MELIILTGMSGAGKSQACDFFEDQGFFCIDNLPPMILPELAIPAKVIGSVTEEKTFTYGKTTVGQRPVTVGGYRPGKKAPFRYQRYRY